MVVLRRAMLGAGAQCDPVLPSYRGTTTQKRSSSAPGPLPHLSTPNLLLGLLKPIAIALLQTSDDRFAVPSIRATSSSVSLSHRCLTWAWNSFQCAWMLCQLMDAFRTRSATPCAHRGSAVRWLYTLTPTHQKQNLLVPRASAAACRTLP